MASSSQSQMRLQSLDRFSPIPPHYTGCRLTFDGREKKNSLKVERQATIGRIT
jgi:hypothetical protein